MNINDFIDSQMADQEWIDTTAGMHRNHPEERRDATEDRRKIDGRHPVNSQVRLNKQRVKETLGGACSCCGLDDARLLDVHHVNKDGKQEREDMGHVSYWRHIWREVSSGSDRYGLLCKNCHYKHHLDDV